MAGTCPQGHESNWDDFCSVCGDAMNGDANGEASEQNPDLLTSAGSCPNCSTSFGSEDVFCENCGYDFATGTLPGEARVAPAATETNGDPESGLAPAPESTPESTAESAPESVPVRAMLIAIVGCDRAYFDEIVGDADLIYPEPEPTPIHVPLTGGKILIGRHSQSRGVYPEIDIEACTGDPAASTRHAMLRRTADGSWTINDLGSTNGTMLMNFETVLTAGTEVPVDAGTVIFIGAYTKITLTLLE